MAEESTTGAYPPGTAKPVRCPLCGAHADVSTGSRCPSCAADLAMPAIAMIADADAAIAQCQAAYDELAARWTQWNAHRATLIEQVQRSRATPANQADFARAVNPYADRAGQSAAREATFAAPATGFAAPASTQAAPARSTSRRLTAPVMLGIAGASLLIAAAVIFVAVTWTTFHPSTQGVLILGVAATVTYISRWLGKQDLAVSGGAVGVVAASFAGVSVFAFDRGSGVLGDFAAAGALLVTSAVGLLLSRQGVRWVQSFAALALLGAGTAATIAFTVQDAYSHWAWVGLAGAIAMAAVGATHGLWRGPVAPRVIRYGAVSLLTAVALISIGPVAFATSSSDTAFRWSAVVGVVAPSLTLLAWRLKWPRSVAAPLGLALPSAIAALTALAGTAPWGWSIAVATVVAGLVLWARTWPRAIRSALLAGLVPAAIVMVVAVLVSGGAATLHAASMLVGEGDISVSVGVGAAAAISGLALVPFRWWRLRDSTAAQIEALGAASVAVGLFAIASGAAQLVNRGDESVLGLATLIAAGAIVAARRLWRHRTARAVHATGATVLASLAGVHGAVALGSGRSEQVWVVVLSTALPILALLVAARWTPKLTVGPAALLITVVGAASASAPHAPWAAVATATAASVALVCWLLTLAPRAWRVPGGVGLLPATAVSATVALVVAIVGIFDLAGVTLEIEFDGSYGWTAIIAVLMAIAAFGTRRLLSREATALAVAVAVAGAWALLAALVLGTSWVGVIATEPWMVPLAGIVLALVVAATSRLWWTADARMTIRLGAGVWTSASTLAAIAQVAFRDAPLAETVPIAAVGTAVLAAVGLRWLRLTLTPAALTITLLVPAIIHAAGGSSSGVVLGAAVAVGALAWLALAVPAAHRPPMLWGGALAAGAVAVAWLAIGLTSVYDMGRVLIGEDGVGAAANWWSVGTTVAVGLAVLAWVRARTQWPWILASVTFVAGGAVSATAAWVALIIAASVVLAIAVLRPGVLGATASKLWWAALVSGGLATLWAMGADVTAAITAVATAGIGWWRLSRPQPRLLPHESDVVLVIAALYGALAAVMAAYATGANRGIAVVAGTVALVVTALVGRAKKLESDPRLAVTIIAGATVVMPFVGASLAIAGAVLLVASAAWRGLRLLGWRPGTWVAAATLSLGVGAILSNAHVGVIEAYIATPATIAIVLGVRQLRIDPNLGTLEALAPGLGLALVPSYLAMIAFPDVAERAVLLTLITLILAVVGVLARWFAPVLAACVTAVAIAVTQVLVTDNAAVRWVAFAVVGALLLVIAATYEKLKKLR